MKQSKAIGGVLLLGSPLCLGAQDGSAPASRQDDPRPDIVWIMTDQHTATALSCAGNRYVRTPNIDRLAERGVRFVNAYCTAPLSGPSRAAMFTGLYPDEIGMIRNGAPFPEELEGRLLGNPVSEAGYECVYGGKWHVGPKHSAPEESGFRRIHPFTDLGLGQACAEWLRGEHGHPFLLVASFDNPHNICEAARYQPLPYGDVTPRRPYPPLPSNFRRNADDADAILFEKANNYFAYPF